MHWFDRLSIYLYHYNRINTWSGNFSKIQGWSSDESQFARFEMIKQAANFNGKHLLDLGCGYGELYDYLSLDFQLAKYTGVDQQHQFLKSARRRLRNERDICQFIRSDISKFTLNDVDIVAASGSLNYQSRDPNYITNMITRMYKIANETVVFNLLDSSTFPAQSLLMGYNKQGIYRYCKTLCSSVEVIEGYANEDFTVVMRK
ncbi:class I SAM-dependent methyltransferase [Vibrio sp. ZSDE26]|uniref:Class I SAM-dependent methyltransferase n=1 Tax=Vibrio amylolyticus TaxID=2847292 RepID=A0A9X1XUF3_9VIBR|nr:class I SAM-dependent methyltransferase [Vibrio amylolyticus]MCK6265794.1 class I SAM-dependent methyltransferase [Vibrio amylolyticus]